jgi:hypothetical protein
LPTDNTPTPAPPLPLALPLPEADRADAPNPPLLRLLDRLPGIGAPPNPGRGKNGGDWTLSPPPGVPASVSMVRLSTDAAGPRPPYIPGTPGRPADSYDDIPLRALRLRSYPRPSSPPIRCDALPEIDSSMYKSATEVFVYLAMAAMDRVGAGIGCRPYPPAAPPAPPAPPGP